MYLNLHVLLKICTTIPVTSCECKWLGGVLKRLQSALGLLHVNYDANINTENVIDIFSRKKN